MPSITSTPAYPVPGRTCFLEFVRTVASSNHIKVWCKAAPEGSTLAKQLAEMQARNTTSHVLTAPMLLIYDGAGGPENIYRLMPEVGGVYDFYLQEYAKGDTSHGGGYQDSPDGYMGETAVDPPVTSSTVYVCNRITQTIGAGADTATLVLHVSGTTIRETSAQMHGEATPAIIDARSPRAATAAAVPLVQTALTALIDITATTALGAIGATMLPSIVGKFDLHCSAAGVHAANDTLNTVSVSYVNMSGPALAQGANLVLRKIRNHFQNTQDGEEPGSQAFHNAGGHGADFANLPVMQSASDMAGVCAMIADLWRAYEAHRVSDVHTAPDGANVLGALPPLLDLHRYFLAELASTAPTVPATENSCAVNLIASAGFKKS